eukprot:m.92310 g.92310  ORF g.92310 m.92310 type:complete len:427 (+) comp8506_c1_seq6:82-1362(+)
MFKAATTEEDEVASELKSIECTITRSQSMSPDLTGSRSTRSRSRMDRTNRKERQRQQEIESSDSRVLLVFNLRPGSHQAFIELLDCELGALAFEERHIDSELPFAFLVFREFHVMQSVLERWTAASPTINEVPLYFVRCAEATPGRDPRMSDEGSPTSTLVLKSLPFDISAADLRLELSSLSCGPPQDLGLHLSPAGTFAGTAYAEYFSPEIATRACHILNGICIRKRAILAEFKRADARRSTQATPITPKSYTPVTPEVETLLDNMRQFCDSGELTRVYSTEHLAGDTIYQLTTAARKLGLNCDANGMTLVVTVPDGRSSSDSSVSRRACVKPIREPKGPDGSYGFRPKDSPRDYRTSSVGSLRSIDSGIEAARRNWSRSARGSLHSSPDSLPPAGPDAAPPERRANSMTMRVRWRPPSDMTHTC